MLDDLPAPNTGDHTGRSSAFPGFQPITGNFLYCPNQFLDVCLRHSSRGTIRLVAYLLRRTLGWLNKNGNPIEQQISVTWNEMISEAGISRGALTAAIDAAISDRFIVRSGGGNPSTSGKPPASARFELLWDRSAEYARDLEAFRGFFAGEGHRTPIPNAFFDSIVRCEPLAVVKVVGAVLRHTVGYQNQFGGRRMSAPLSFSYLQRYVGISSRPALNRAVQHALEAGYILRVQDGTFDFRVDRRRPATYAVKWLAQPANKECGSKRTPAENDRFRKDTSSSSETTPAKRFKKDTKEKTEKKNTDKQQTDKAVVVDLSDSMKLLIDAGFGEPVARKLADGRSADEIRNQIDWLELRQPNDNPLGMLRRAIEDNWSAPAAITAKQQKSQATERSRQQQEREATEDARIAKQKRQRRERRQKLRAHWQTLAITEKRRHHEAAIKAAAGTVMRRRLNGHTDLNEPPRETLEVMARATRLPTGESS